MPNGIPDSARTRSRTKGTVSDQLRMCRWPGLNGYQGKQVETPVTGVAGIPEFREGYCVRGH